MLLLLDNTELQQKIPIERVKVIFTVNLETFLQDFLEIVKSVLQSSKEILKKCLDMQRFFLFICYPMKHDYFVIRTFLFPEPHGSLAMVPVFTVLKFKNVNS